jgi:putative transcriptional regulator
MMLKSPKGIPMNVDLFAELEGSVREGGAILRGERPASRRFAVDVVDVKRIRATYRLTQDEFAARLGISVKTLRNWEHGRRQPQGPAQVLLQVAARHPKAVADVIRRAPQQGRHSTNQILESTGDRKEMP